MALIAKLSLLIVCVIAHLAAGAQPASGPFPDGSLHTPDPIDADPLFCVVVRTYWGHGDAAGGGLRQLLRSLQRQTHQRWEAVLLIADSKPFPDVHRIVADLNDTRIWIGPAFKPKNKGTWVPEYHGMLYNLTDDALTACPRGTTWAVATNGDNVYAPNFMATVIAETEKAIAIGQPPPDVVAFDFYSRYQRVTAEPCRRFAARPAPASPCKPNLMRWCHTDLGSYVMNLPRLRADGLRFGGLKDESDRMLDDDSIDGLMAEALVNSGWKVAHVTDQCLFAHSPTFQECVGAGGVWDDRDVTTPEGSTCLTPEQAAAALKDDPDAEELIIKASQDGNAAEMFEEADVERLAAAWCLRRRDWDSRGRLGITRTWFSRHCAEEEDLEEFDASMKEWFPTDEAMEGAVDAALDHTARAQQRQFS